MTSAKFSGFLTTPNLVCTHLKQPPSFGQSLSNPSLLTSFVHALPVHFM